MKGRLEEDINVLLNKLKLTIAVAESATGGLISSLITDIPGSSNYFKGISAMEVVKLIKKV